MKTITDPYPSTWPATSAASTWDIIPQLGIEGISVEEEINLREENEFVKELYEQYKVAVILASGASK